VQPADLPEWALAGFLFGGLENVGMERQPTCATGTAINSQLILMWLDTSGHASWYLRKEKDGRLDGNGGRTYGGGTRFPAGRHARG
jgi:hypothetical protein